MGPPSGVPAGPPSRVRLRPTEVSLYRNVKPSQREHAQLEADMFLEALENPHVTVQSRPLRKGLVVETESWLQRNNNIQSMQSPHVTVQSRPLRKGLVAIFLAHPSVQRSLALKVTLILSRRSSAKSYRQDPVNVPLSILHGKDLITD